MLVSAALLLLLAASAAGVGFLARLVRRPVPAPLLALFGFLPILLFPRAFVSQVTPLPLDHAVAIQPWHSPHRPPPHNPYLNDVATQILPWAKAVRGAWKEGELPLRSPWNGCGMALAANSQSAAFFPLTILAFLLPLARAFTWIAAVKLLLAMTGMWLWLRELGASSRAAGFAAVAFAFSFSFTPWLFFPMTSVLCLWPWMLFAVELTREPGSRKRAIALLAGVFAFGALAGHPESVALGCLFIALWLLGRWALADLPDFPRIARSIALAAAIAVGLTAFLLLPSVLAIESSNRAATAAQPFWQPIFSWAPHAAAWRSGLLTPLFPHTLGNAVGSPMIPGFGSSFSEMAAGHFGIAGWAAVLLMFRPGSRRTQVEWVLAGLLACGLGVAVGSWPLAELAGQIPILRMIFPLRFLTWLPLAGCALAALELDRYARDVQERRAGPAAGVLIPVVLALAAVAVFVRFREDHAKAGGADFQGRQLLLVLGVLALCAVLAVATRHRPRLLAAGMTVLCGAELLYQGREFYRLHSAAYLFPETPLIRFLRGMPGVFRVVAEDFVLFPNTSVFAGLQDVRTHDAVERRDYVRFLDATCGYAPADYFKRIRNLNAPVLDFLNVRYLVAAPDRQAPGEKWRPVYAGEDGSVFENREVMPRAFAPTRIRVVRPASDSTRADANSAFGETFGRLAAASDWRQLAYVLGEREDEAANAPAVISDYQETVNSASLRVRVPSGHAAAILVLSLVQDGGWSARTQSGTEVPVVRANGPFLALKLPPGAHVLALKYTPPGFRLGVTISMMTMGVLVASAIVLRFGAGRIRGSQKREPTE